MSGKYEVNIKLQAQQYSLNSSVTNFGIKNVIWELLLKTSVVFFIILKTVGNIKKKAIKLRAIVCNVGIQLEVSNYKKFKLDACNRTPRWLHANYATNRHAEKERKKEICDWLLMSLVDYFIHHSPFFFVPIVN